MVEYLYEKLAAVDDVDELHVVTNSRFAGDFTAWRDGAERPLPVTVHDDGTSTNDDRLGALGDIRFVVERAGLLGEDLLVVAGDNLFEFELGDMVSFWRSKADGSAIGVHDVGDRELAKQYGIAAPREGGEEQFEESLGKRRAKVAELGKE